MRIQYLAGDVDIQLATRVQQDRAMRQLHQYRIPLTDIDHHKLFWRSLQQHHQCPKHDVWMASSKQQNSIKRQHQGRRDKRECDLPLRRISKANHRLKDQQDFRIDRGGQPQFQQTKRHHRDAHKPHKHHIDQGRKDIHAATHVCLDWQGRYLRNERHHKQLRCDIALNRQ